MSVKAGKLNRRIVIEKPVKTTDAAGQPITTWQEHMRCWARLVSGSAGEALQDNRQVTEDVRWSIELRYSSLSSQVAADMRIQHAGKTLSIQSAVDVDDAHKLILLTTIERK